MLKKARDARSTERDTQMSPGDKRITSGAGRMEGSASVTRTEGQSPHSLALAETRYGDSGSEEVEQKTFVGQVKDTFWRTFRWGGSENKPDSTVSDADGEDLPSSHARGDKSRSRLNLAHDDGFWIPKASTAVSGLSSLSTSPESTSSLVRVDSHADSMSASVDWGHGSSLLAGSSSDLRNKAAPSATTMSMSASPELGRGSFLLGSRNDRRNESTLSLHSMSTSPESRRTTRREVPRNWESIAQLSSTFDRFAEIRKKFSPLESRVPLDPTSRAYKEQIVARAVNNTVRYWDNLSKLFAGNEIKVKEAFGSHARSLIDSGKSFPIQRYALEEKVFEESQEIYGVTRLTMYWGGGTDEEKFMAVCREKESEWETANSRVQFLSEAVTDIDDNIGDLLGELERVKNRAVPDELKDQHQDEIEEIRGELLQYRRDRNERVGKLEAAKSVKKEMEQDGTKDFIEQNSKTYFEYQDKVLAQIVSVAREQYHADQLEIDRSFEQFSKTAKAFLAHLGKGGGLYREATEEYLRVRERANRELLSVKKHNDLPLKYSRSVYSSRYHLLEHIALLRIMGKPPTFDKPPKDIGESKILTYCDNLNGVIQRNMEALEQALEFESGGN